MPAHPLTHALTPRPPSTPSQMLKQRGGPADDVHRELEELRRENERLRQRLEEGGAAGLIGLGGGAGDSTVLEAAPLLPGMMPVGNAPGGAQAQALAPAPGVLPGLQPIAPAAPVHDASLLAQPGGVLDDHAAAAAAAAAAATISQGIIAGGAQLPMSLPMPQPVVSLPLHTQQMAAMQPVVGPAVAAPPMQVLVVPAQAQAVQAAHVAQQQAHSLQAAAHVHAQRAQEASHQVQSLQATAQAIAQTHTEIVQQIESVRSAAAAHIHNPQVRDGMERLLFLTGAACFLAL
jgi:hypothetical protein